MLLRAIRLGSWGLLVSLACAAEPPQHGANILLSRDPQKLLGDHNSVYVPQTWFNVSQPALGDPAGLPVPTTSFADHYASSTTGGSHTYGDPAFTVKATSNSPGVITYSVISGNATVTTAGLVTLTGTGQVTIEASQTATIDYASTIATLTFVVNPASPTIVFTGQNQIANNDFVVSATSNATGSFTYSVVSGPAMIAGNRVTPTGSGIVLIKASEAADSNYMAASEEASFTVTPAVLTVKANSCSRAFGAVNPLFTGSIVGNNTADLFTETFSTTADVTSTAGEYALIPAASGQKLSKYAITIEPGTVTITQAPTLTTLSSTSTTATPESAVITAHVTSLTSGIPDGTLTFFDNGAALQTVPVAGGMALLTTTLSPGITHLITGSSSGDANFLGSSTATGLSVTVAPQDFSFVSVGPSTQTALPGTSTSFGFSLSPLHGSVDSPVVFSVTGVPSEATVVFTPSKLFVGSGSASVQLLVQTAGQTSQQDKVPNIPKDSRAFLTAAIVTAFWSRKRLRTWNKRMRLVSLLMVGSIGSSLWLAGCGAGIMLKTPQSYNLVVVATSGVVQHSQAVTLLVE